MHDPALSDQGLRVQRSMKTSPRRQPHWTNLCLCVMTLTNLSGEHRAKTVPPEPHGFVGKEILDRSDNGYRRTHHFEPSGVR